ARVLSRRRLADASPGHRLRRQARTEPAEAGPAVPDLSRTATGLARQHEQDQDRRRLQGHLRARAPRGAFQRGCQAGGLVVVGVIFPVATEVDLPFASTRRTIRWFDATYARRFPSGEKVAGPVSRARMRGALCARRFWM